MMGRQVPRIVFAVWLLAVAACAGARAGAQPSAEPAIQPMVADRLVFGRAIPDGGTVSEEDWSAFLEEVVTPRFPEGLTVWRAEGQWTDPSGVLVEESVLMIEIVHPASSSADSAMDWNRRASEGSSQADAVIENASARGVRRRTSTASVAAAVERAA